mgnify:CR=1 FL=1
MAKIIPKATPDAIHVAAEAVRSVIHRFVQPLLEASVALDSASAALVATEEVEQRRDVLKREIAALGADLARDQQAAVAARTELSVLHEAAVRTLDADYIAKAQAAEATFTKTQGERLVVLGGVEHQITEATEEFDRLQREHTTAQKWLGERLAAMTMKATQEAQATLARQQNAERTVQQLEERIRHLRGEAQREATRLRELADRAG